jgi:Mor family transcriptional regulator
MTKSTGKAEKKANDVANAVREYAESRELRDRTIAQAMSRNAENVKRIARKYNVSLSHIRTVYNRGNDE